MRPAADGTGAPGPVATALRGSRRHAVTPRRGRLGRGGLALIPATVPHDVRGVGFFAGAALVHRFSALVLLGAEELGFILAHTWRQLGLTFAPDDDTDAEALAAIIRVTGGNFRLLERLLTEVGRILRVNQVQVVTKEVVETAREGLVIGAA